MIGAYYTAVTGMLSKVMETQGAAIAEAGRLGAEAILGGGLMHAIGTGHSHMIAEEMFDRAGGLVLANAILEPSLMLHEGVQRSSSLERLPGYVQRLMELEPLSPGDLLIVISNSGRNAVPVEAALYGRERGLRVAAITSVAHSASQPPNHASGKRLYEVADVVIDNCGVPGDAVLPVGGPAVMACATSTVVGAFIMQAITAAVVERLAAAGMNPLPVLRSGNLEGASDHNRRVRAAYMDRIAKMRAYLG
ncbi:MAG: hypothetical protein K0R39_575 [Symbiobacteriaceae bacterium]|jgi:uncharacterized phosphosugar-binding protein|nr:hypothetical protein [Symbiobacteriaceae bacterium]